MRLLFILLALVFALPCFAQTKTLIDSNTITDTSAAGVTAITTFTKVGSVGGGYIFAADTVYTDAISVRLEDQAGNLSAPVLLPRHTFDNTAPSQPTVSLLNSDTGSSATDNITCMGSGFSLSGAATYGSLVSIYDGEVLLGTAPVQANKWSWTYTGSALTEGVHNIIVRSTDMAGNLSAYSSSLLLDIEVSAVTPVKAYENRLWIGNNTTVDTGNPDDQLISGNSISLTGRMAPNATVWLYNDRNNNGLLDSGELISTSLSTDGAGLISASTLTLPGGVNRLRAMAMDGQGQLIGTQSDALVVTSQRTMPMLPGTPRLLAPDGITPDEDGFTELSQPSFRIDLPVTGDGVVQVGDQVVMKNSATELVRASITASDIAQGFVVLKVLPNQALTAGNYNNVISVQLIDGAGSISQSATVTTLTVAGGLPSSAVFSIAPTVASDLGASPYDRITNTTSPTLRVYLGTGAAAGGVVEVFNASTTGASDANRKGMATLTAAHLSQGYVDVNTSALATGKGTNYFRYTALGASKSATLTAIANLTIDTTAPVLAVGLNLADSDDTGRSSSDNITRLNQIVTFNATGTVSNAAEIAWLNVYDGSQLIGRASVGNVQGGIVFSFTLPAGVTLSDGLHRFSVRPVDFAGNEGAAVSLDVTIDATAPTGLTASLANADLTDTVNRLTSNVNALTLSGSAEANARISVFNDSNNNGQRDLGESHLALYTKDTGTVITSTVVVDGAGAYTVDLRGLAVGAYNLRVVQTDVAGNEQVSAAVAFTVDTSALAPQSMVLLSSSDTGESSYDGQTSDNTPTLRIDLASDAVEGDKLRINVSNTAAGTQLGLLTLTAADIAAGYIEFTPSAMANGTYSSTTAITAFMIDRAGNTSSGVGLRTALVVKTSGPSAPASAPNLVDTDDTGNFSTDVADTDNRVNRGTNLSFASSGALPTGTTRVELFDTFGGNTVSLGLAAMTSATTWAFSYQGPAWADGTHAITWRASDVNGNWGPTSSALNVVVDTTGPSALTPTPGSATTPALRVALKNTATNDTGTLGDNTTSLRLPIINGVAEPGSRISIYEDRNGSGVVEPSELILNSANARFVKADASTGAFEFALGAYQKAGIHNYIVVQTDVAGNMVASAPLSITIDYSATKPLWLALQESTSVDSGYLSNDKVTNAAPQVMLRLPADARVGDTARVRVLNYLNGTAHSTLNKLLTQADLDAGQVLFAFTRAQMNSNTSAKYYIDGAIVDAAGNTPVAKGLSTGSVTGSYNVLYETRPPADPYTANLYVGDGSNSNLTANLLTRTATTTLNRLFTVEGTVPARASNDSLADVVMVQVYDRVGTSLVLMGEAGVNTSNNVWALTYDGSALKQGVHSLVVRSVDMAGNVSATDAELLATTSVLNLTINNAEVTVEPADRIRPELLGGLSFNGNTLTLTMSEAVQGDIPASAFTLAVNGELVSITSIVRDPADASQTRLIITLANAVTRGQAVTLAYTDPSSADNSIALQDLAGNDAASFYVSADAVTNMNPPAAPGTPDLVGDDDSGYSSLDNNTKLNGFRIAVNIPQGVAAGDSLEIARDDAASTSLKTVVLTAANIASGRVMFALPAETTGLGALTGQVLGLKARVVAPTVFDGTTTTALASAWSGVLNVVLDVVAPPVPNLEVINELAIDPVTREGWARNNRPVLGGSSEAGALIKFIANGVVLGTSTADAQGHWTFDTNDSNLADGSYAITLSATDTAGNLSPLSAPFTLIIDSEAPKVPWVLAVQNDTGPLATDGITSTRTQVVSGTADPRTYVDVFRDGVKLGTVLSTASGTWLYNDVVNNTPRSLADGVYVYTAIGRDRGNNASAESAPFTVVVDNLAPAVPVIRTATPDTGVSSTDRLTNTSSLELKGTAEANSLVQIFLGGTAISNLVGVASTNSSGAWTFDTTSLALPEGVHVFQAKGMDLAGNASAASATFSVTIDTTPPVATTGLALNGVAISAAKTVSSGNLTYTGRAEPGAQVFLSLDGQFLGVATADVSTGLWSFEDSVNVLGDAPYKLTVQTQDRAGNLGGMATFDFTVHATQPLAPVIARLTSATDTGLSDSDRITRNVTPALSGTAVAGSTVKVFSFNRSTLAVSSSPVFSAVAAADGSWSAALPTTLTVDGDYAFKATATDAAGLTSAYSASLVMQLDTVAPTGLTMAAVASDNIVNASEQSAGITLKGTTEIGASLLLSFGSGATKRTVIPDSFDNDWTYTLTAEDFIALGEGAARNIELIATDVAARSARAPRTSAATR
jgi:hypothetical protein